MRLRKPCATIIPTNNHTMYMAIVTRAYLNCARRLNNFHSVDRQGDGARDRASGVAWRGNMSASAREPESPRPVSDDPPNGSPEGDAHRGDAASVNRSSGPTLNAPKTGRQTQPGQDPTRQNLNTPPAGARTEAPEPSQPAWKHKRPPRAFAGDVAMAELRNDLAEASDDEPPDPAPEPVARIFGAKGLI